MNSAVGVVGSLFVNVAGSGRQFFFKTVIFISSVKHGDDDIIGVKFGEMAHAKLTVSDPVLVAVIVLILKPPDVVVDWVTPALNVAVKAELYFKITIPDPPLPPA